MAIRTTPDGLDKAASALSYLNGVPGLSTVSGIVLIIAGIRDAIFGALQPPMGPEESMERLAAHKLDNWSHLRKGLLALIPVIGNAILLGEGINRRLDLSRVHHYFSPGERLLATSVEDLPKSLLQDKDFCFKAIQDKGRSEIYQHSTLKDDRELSLLLIQKNNLDEDAWKSFPENWKEEEAFACAIVNRANDFSKLPEIARNNANVVKSFLEKHSESWWKDLCFDHVSDKKVLQQDETVCKNALKIGALNWVDLDEAQRTAKMAVYALFFDVNQFQSLPQEIRGNVEVMKAVINSWRKKADTLGTWNPSRYTKYAQQLGEYCKSNGELYRQIKPLILSFEAAHR